MSRKLRICLAQMEVVPTDIQGNKAKVLGCIKKAKADKAEMVVLSELCLTGYLIGDMWERQSFLNESYDALKEVQEASQGIIVVIGNIKTDGYAKNKDGRIRKYNTCFVMQDGVMLVMVNKSLLPMYREFDDGRHFYSFLEQLFDAAVTTDAFSLNKNTLKNQFTPKLTTKNGIEIGFLLCEDSWSNDYTVSPADMLYENGTDVIINISCSPYTQGKNDKRNRVFSTHAKKHGKVMVYVNNVGCQNNGKTIYAFDGNSCIYDRYGDQLNPYEPFAEGCETFEIDVDEAFGCKNYTAAEEGIAMIYKAHVYGVKKFMEQIGVKRVVIGLSGGIDSAVVAALMADILPPEDIMGVNMPSQFNSELTKGAASQLAKNLSCHYKIIPIQESVDLTRRQLEEAGIEFKDDAARDFAFENVQARDRSARILAAVAAAFGGAFTCNANKSEATVGYTTFNGDLAGFCAPICDLWKGQVYELGRYYNKTHNNKIPEEIFSVKPSAELGKHQDVTKGLGDPLIYPYHDKLFASWTERWQRAIPEDNFKWFNDGVLAEELGYGGEAGTIEELFPDVETFMADLEHWWKCYQGLGIAKRLQIGPVFCTSRRGFGFDLRESQTIIPLSANYKKMKTAHLLNKPNLFKKLREKDGYAKT